MSACHRGCVKTQMRDRRMVALRSGGLSAGYRLSGARPLRGLCLGTAIGHSDNFILEAAVA
jgi:hypothetical protein